MTSMPKDLKKVFKSFLDIFLLVVPLEILSQYPEIDNSHWLRQDVQWIMDKVFTENG